ncbi:hypothetical protein DYH09_20705 [bacterium CPR1]|nr:hypothetical protein [bacterium CPR1]
MWPNETLYFLACLINNQDGGMALNSISPHNGRAIAFIGVNSLKGKLIAELCLQPIHDGLHRRSRRSAIGVNKDQGELSRLP